jgi:hypothetical protein
MAGLTLIGLVSLPGELICDFPTFALKMSIVDDQFHGLMLNLYSVSLLEYLEVFGMMLFYRVVLHKTRIPDQKQSR